MEPGEPVTKYPLEPATPRFGSGANPEVVDTAVASAMQPRPADSPQGVAVVVTGADKLAALERMASS